MKFIRRATDQEIHHTWLKSERIKIERENPNINLKLLHFERKYPNILNSPNFEDENENQRRKELLLYRRGKIIRLLPQDIVWHIVKIEQNDIKNLYIIPSFDWFLDTGRTFKLVDVLKNLSPNRGYYFSLEFRGPITHFNEVNRILAFWESNKEARLDEYLILVSTSKRGPFTIIDGTHRAVAYLKKEESCKGTFFCKAYCGISQKCKFFGWHIESDKARQHIKDFKNRADRGELW